MAVKKTKKIEEMINEVETTPEVVETPLSDIDVSKNLKSKSDQMRDALEAQPKVSFMIPLSEGENAGSFQPVTINGYQMRVPKGEIVQVPLQVAEMLAERYNIEMNLGKKNLISRSKDIQDALS